MSKTLSPCQKFAEYLRLDPETGKLYWIKKSGPRCVIGSEAGTLGDKGYIVVQFKGRRYKAHRIVWLLTHGEWPSKEIDHRNKKKSDNRPDNLRDVSHSINMQNSISWAISGHKGVYATPEGRYMARHLGKHLGIFNTALEASAAFQKERTNVQDKSVTEAHAFVF